MLFERVDDLPVVIQPKVGSLIWRDRLQQEDRNHEAIGFLSGEAFCHDSEGFRLPNTTLSTQQLMRGIGMLFDPQGQLLINLFQVRMPHGDGLKGFESCFGLWCQFSHISDTPRSGEGCPDPTHRPFRHRHCSAGDLPSLTGPPPLPHTTLPRSPPASAPPPHPPPQHPTTL